MGRILVARTLRAARKPVKPEEARLMQSVFWLIAAAGVKDRLAPRPAHAFAGGMKRQVLRRICKHCGKPAEHHESHDAYYCKNCNLWLESVCLDPFCAFCGGRPDSPNAEVSDRRAHGNNNTTGANGGSLH
jgi:hypothetical protein